MNMVQLMQQGWSKFRVRDRPVYLLMLVVYHTFVFSIAYPRWDIPTWDDCHQFGWGRSLMEGRGPLLGDWSPILTYVSVLNYGLVPADPLTRFFILSYLSKLVFLFGAFVFIATLCGESKWGFWATLFLSIFLTYWTHLNGHTFSFGVLLLLLPFMEKMGPKNLWAIGSLALLVLLLRREHILIAVGFGLYWLGREGWNDSWRSCFRWTPATALWVGAAVLGWLPILIWGDFGSGRLDVAFQQQIATFIVFDPHYAHLQIPWDTHYLQVLEKVFPPEQRQENTLLGRILPLYSLVSANPRVFWDFLLRNMGLFWIGKFEYAESPILNQFLNVSIWLGGLAFLASIYLKKERDRYHLFYFSLVFILSLIPCLITWSLRRYVLPAIVWFFGVVPYYVLSERTRTTLAATLVVIAFVLQYPEWKKLHAPNTDTVNRRRVTFLTEALERIDAKDIALAEPFIFFSYAFCDRVDRSYSYARVGLKPDGNVAAEEDEPVEYLLLEDDRSRFQREFWFQYLEEMKALAQHRGRLVAENGGFSLWQFDPAPVPPPLAQTGVIVTDDLSSLDDLSNGIDRDGDPRELVIHWRMESGDFAAYHVYVSVDGAVLRYLGIQISAIPYFVWRQAFGQKAFLHEDFTHGPEYGHTYRFRVYAIPPDDDPQKIRFLDAAGPVQFLPLQ